MTEAAPGPKRVLSIQSHVVSGCTLEHADTVSDANPRGNRWHEARLTSLSTLHFALCCAASSCSDDDDTTDVGNKAAVFPLQLLGFDVDIINSVHFSNHTGYPHGVQGDVLKGDQLRAVMAGLEANGLLSDTGHLLTGYIGSVSFLEAVLDVLELLRRQGRVRYVCDPVLGDRGQFYVPPELVDVYRQRVVPLSDVITPNQFEVEQLTGLTVDSLTSAEQACRVLHELGPSIVCITSIVLPGNDDAMSIVASHRKNGITEVWFIEFPRLPGNFTGTGDLCAALLLAHTALIENLPEALERVIDTMSVVIERTHASSSDTTQSCELKLIQSRKDIENPPMRFKAKRL